MLCIFFFNIIFFSYILWMNSKILVKTRGNLSMVIHPMSSPGQITLMNPPWWITYKCYKLDKVAPLMIHPPTTYSASLYEDKNIYLSDMWHMPHGGWWTFSQNVMSLALTVWEWMCFQNFRKRITDLIRHRAVCRTAPATLSLSNT